MGNGKGPVDTGVLTQQMIENAAQMAAANHGRASSIFISNSSWATMWDNKYENTPYANLIFMDDTLGAFAKMHLLLFKLKVSKFDPKENYDYINQNGAERMKNIRPKPTEKTLRRIKRIDKRRQEDEKLPYYKRGLSWNSRGRI